MMPANTQKLARSAVLASALLAPSAAAQGDYAVKAGTVLTMDGAPIEDGVIVIESGRITAVGPASEVELPWEVPVLDVPDMVAFPGFVEAHTARGTDRPNESLDVSPYLDVRDAIDPVNYYFESALRAGITTINVQQGNDTVIGGQGRIVRPHGMTVEQMTVRPDAGLKIVAGAKSGKSRATHAQALRVAFDELRRHLEELVAENQDERDLARREALYQGREQDPESSKGRAMAGQAWQVEGLEKVPRSQIDEQQAPLLEVVEGRMPVWLSCELPMDVRVAVEVARQNGFLEQTTFVLGAECWKAADEIAQAGAAVVLDPELVHIERDPVTGEERETFVPGVFADKGVPFALQSTGSSNESLWYQAAMCVAYGLSREDALAAVTTVPARMLGLEDRVGRLAPGLDGNVVLFSADPLSVTSFVEYVVLEGDLVYDRSKDVRVKHLLEGIEPESTAPAGSESAAEHDDDHDEPPETDDEAEDGDADETDDEEEGGSEDGR